MVLLLELLRLLSLLDWALVLLLLSFMLEVVEELVV